MSQKEFQGLLNQGSVLTSSQFWSGKNPSLKEMESESTSNELKGSAQSSEVQQWKEKLEAAQQELETVRTNLCAQLEKARQMAETIKEELEGE